MATIRPSFATSDAVVGELSASDSDHYEGLVNGKPVTIATGKLAAGTRGGRQLHGLP
jgi:hypothetical protein